MYAFTYVLQRRSVFVRVLSWFSLDISGQACYLLSFTINRDYNKRDIRERYTFLLSIVEQRS